MSDDFASEVTSYYCIIPYVVEDLCDEDKDYSYLCNTRDIWVDQFQTLHESMIAQLPPLLTLMPPSNPVASATSASSPDPTIVATSTTPAVPTPLGPSPPYSLFPPTTTTQLVPETGHDGNLGKEDSGGTLKMAMWILR